MAKATREGNKKKLLNFRCTWGASTQPITKGGGRGLDSRPCRSKCYFEGCWNTSSRPWHPGNQRGRRRRKKQRRWWAMHGRAWTYWNERGEGGGEKAYLSFFISFSMGNHGIAVRNDSSVITFPRIYTARIEKCTVAFLIRPSKCPKCPSTPTQPVPVGEREAD